MALSILAATVIVGLVFWCGFLFGERVTIIGFAQDAVSAANVEEREVLLRVVAARSKRLAAKTAGQD